MQEKNLGKVKTKERAINNGFLKKYSTALSSVASTFQKEKPDYILALARKGPRLLELMRLDDIWAGDIPVISEKAIDFIPYGQLKDKKVIIFDDIIISGTTIKDLLSNLVKKYDAEIKLICVAIDKDTIALDNDGRGNYWIEVDLSDGKKEKIYLDYKMALSRDERFIFCNEIVRSFAFLNKPYDMDYPIFYTYINSEVMSSLITQSKPDKAYSLTTVYQHNNGYQRYTFLPAEKTAMANLINNVFHDLNTHPQIYKIRAYFNKKTKEAALVPMVTFGISKELIKKKKIFSGHFSCYNDLINQARGFIDSEKEAEAIYRLIWYIVNYIYGLSFHLRNSTDRYQLLHYSLPSQALNYQDLLYLFGPSLSQIIMEFLDLHFVENVEELKRIHNLPSDWAVEDYKRLPSESDAPTFDTQRRNMYSEIESYIKGHIKAGDTITDQIATIFEGLYRRIEIPTQENVRKTGIRGDEHERLKTGFNYEQIKDILYREGMICQDLNDVDLHISLALDFLVDAGIQIPIFYYKRDDGYLERAYRWGEDALASFAKRFGYLAASATRGLFKYIKDRGDEKIPKIPFEKIGVMFFEELKMPGNEIVDILDDSTIPPGDDRVIKITPDFSRHGRVSYIYEEELTDDPQNRYMFVEWCKKEGIVEYDSEGKNVLYSNEFFERNDFSEGGYIPRLISESKIAPFESLAKLLYQIDRDIDKSQQSDFLIALTTCGDHKSYLEAIRVMLALFFRSPDGKFLLPLKSAMSLVEGKEEEEIGRGIKFLFNNPELGNDLNKSIPSEKLIDAFQSTGFLLSKEANLWKEKDDKWIIAYKEKNKDVVFIAKKKDGQLT